MTNRSDNFRRLAREAGVLTPIGDQMNSCLDEALVTLEL